MLKELPASPIPAPVLDEPAWESAEGPAGDVFVVPMSFAQQRLWLIERIQPGLATYNVPFALRLAGPLDAVALEEALREMEARHESLRTTFGEEDGEPVQQIWPEVGLRLPVIDLAALPEARREREALDRIHEDAERPFDLARPPLARAALFRLAATTPERHALYFNLHHIITDAWSGGILVRELFALYESLLAGEPSPLPDLAIQYADFADWQRQWLQGETLELKLHPLRRRLEGIPATLTLPTDRPRTTAVRSQGDRVRFELPKALPAALKDLCRESGTTLFMALLASFQALLSRVSGQEDVVVGTTAANRTRGETEGVLGFFVNTLALRGDLSGDPGFRDLLARVKEVTVEAFAHEDLPFEKLVEALRPERRLDQTPLFQVMLNFQPAQIARFDKAEDGLAPRSEFLEVWSRTAKFDLTLDLAEEHDGTLHGSWEYSAALFDRTTVQRLAGQWQNLLADAAGANTRPDRRLSELALLTEPERHQLRAEHNLPRPDPHAVEPLHRQFARQAERTPDAVAVSEPGEGGLALTYRELRERAGRLARHLRGVLNANGAGPEALVGLCAERSPDLLVGILGILEAGAGYLPLDPDYPAERLDFMVRDSGAAALVSQRRWAGRLFSFDRPVVILEEALQAEASGAALPEVSPSHLAYVIYTSGSTGRPKGVPVSHANVARLFAATDPWFGFGDRDVWTLFHSFAFDFSVWEIWGALLHGGRLVVVPYWVSRSPEAFLELLHREGVTVLSQTPSAFGPLARLAAESRAGAPESLRFVLFGGEALPIRSLEPWFARFGDRKPRLVNLYGITETTVHVTCRPLAAGEALPFGSPVGRPIPDQAVHLLDRFGLPVPLGVIGEIFVGGHGTARGYLGRPDLTAARFVPDPFSEEPGARLYRSGDLARRLADGQLEFLGRADQQVKIRGFRIEPGEIEAALASHPALREAAVAVRQAPSGETVLVAYAVAREGAAPGPRALKDFLAGKLPEHMVPATYVELSSLPRTASGKVDRAALPDPRTEASAGFVPPRTPLEEVLAGLWANQLRVEPIGAHDNFFDLGGHSLTATGLIGQVRATFGVELPARAVFELPTLAELAGRVEQLLAGGTKLELPPVTPRDPREDAAGLPLSFSQRRLWFLDQLAGGETPHYNIAAALSLEGDLEVPALAAALTEVTRRHEVLRTTFGTARDGQPVQVIHPPRPFPLPLVDLRGLANREDEMLRLVRVEETRPFDLANGPLLRGCLLALAANRHTLLVNLHHVVSDAWSMEIFVKELAALYRAFAAGKPLSAAGLPELPVQYADFALWQRRHLAGATLDAQLAYWTEHLAGAPTVLELQTDHPRPAVQTYAGRLLQVQLPAAAAAALRRLSREQRGTLFMTSLAVFSGFLQRHTGQTDLLLGTPVANRSRAETESLIGFFVNVLVMRAKLAGEPTFRKLLERVREDSLGAYAHQDLPFEHLVEALQPERDLSRNALFQVMLNVTPMPTPAQKVAGLQMGFQEADLGTVFEQFDLTLRVVDAGETMILRLGSNADLFEAATLHRMGHQLVNLFGAFAADPDLRVAEAPLLTGEEQRQLALWGDHETDLSLAFRPFAECPPSAAVLFERQARERPGAVALALDSSELTYEELNHRANRLAHHLRGLGLAPEDRVAVALERAVDFVVAFLAVLKAGGTYTPLDVEMPAERLQYLFADSDARFLVTRETIEVPRPDGIATVRLDSDAALLARRPVADPEPWTAPLNLAYLLYTSGSTGNPKGVLVSHEALIAHSLSFVSQVGLGPEDRVLRSSAFTFDVSLNQMLPTFAAGATLYLWEFDIPGPEELGRVVMEQRITVALFTASVWYHAVRAWADGRPALHAPWVRWMGTCGEAMPDDGFATWHRSPLRHAVLANCYGPTETVIIGTLYEAKPDGFLPQDLDGLPIGRSFLGYTVHLLDASGLPVPVGAVGEICQGGLPIARGYLNRPDRTAELFVPGPNGERIYRTGDLGRYRNDGQIEFVGRRDHQIKLRGYRIEPGEIETTLVTHPAVRAAAVIVREGAAGPESRSLVAYVAGHPGEPVPSTPELREYLRDRLPVYMVPTTFVEIPELPFTVHGKLDRAALPAPAPVEVRAEPRKEAPAPPPVPAPAAPAALPVAPAYFDPLEDLVADLWRELLEVQEIRPDDNFFDLGGHSLLFAVLRAKLNHELGADLQMLDLFRHATVRSLAEYLRRELGDLLPPEVQAPAVSAAPEPAPQPAAPVPANAYDTEPARQDPMEFLVTGLWQELLDIKEIRPDDNFFDIGGHSLLFAVLRARLNQELGTDLPMLDLFRHATVRSLAEYLRRELADLLPPVEATEPAALAPAPAAAPAVNPTTHGAPQVAADRGEIAIVGMAARFPGADDVERFWANLRDGVDSVTFFNPGGREAWTPPAGEPVFFVPAKGVIAGAEDFDAAFFGYNDRDALLLDPQHRAFLECAWTALEHAGYDAEQYPGRIGVFGGANKRDYLILLAQSDILTDPTTSAQATVSTELDAFTPRVAFKIGLDGPTVNVQNGCATGLVALHVASQSLRAGECDIAVVGAASITSLMRTGCLYNVTDHITPTGQVRAFDRGADGTLDSDGVGIVVLKRLAEALADGDHIHAVVKGGAMANEGGNRPAFRTSTVESRGRVIEEALRKAGVSPSTVGFVATDVGGAQLADQIEIVSLARVFAGAGPAESCALGSAMANLGHCNGAAGIASLLQAVLALEHGEIPPTPHFRELMAEVDLGGTPLYVTGTRRDFPAPAGAPRRASVNSLGLGGVVTHHVLEEAPPRPASSAPVREGQLLVLSARTATALETATENLASWLERHPEVPLADVAWTLQAGRRALEHRRVLLCADTVEASEILRRKPAGRLRTAAIRRRRAPVALVLPAVRAEALESLREAAAPYRQEPAFREEVERGCGLLRPALARRLREALLASGPLAEMDADEAELALFLFQYALGRLWQGWLGELQAVSGEGVGEYAAACLTGAATLEDALGTLAARGVQPGRFAAALGVPADAPDRIVLVIGAGAPEDSKEPAVRRLLETAALTVAALPAAGDPAADRHPLATLGQVWLAGAAVDWNAFHAGETRHRLALPTYPFERRRFWVDVRKDPAEALQLLGEVSSLGLELEE